MKLRPAVQLFAEQMELQLRNNDHKTNDFEEECDIVARVVEELAEFLRACVGCDKSIKGEAADVANFLCMLVKWHYPGYPSINEKAKENEE